MDTVIQVKQNHVNIRHIRGVHFPAGILSRALSAWSLPDKLWRVKLPN